MPFPRTLLSLALGLCAPLTVLAADHEFQINPGPLASTLLSISEQSGEAISFDPQLVAPLQAPAVRGRLSNEQAIDAALQGSGLVARPGTHGILVEPAPAANTPLSTSDLPPAAALAVVTVTSEHRSEDLQRTPLAISAFDSQRLEQTQVKSVRDLAGQVPNLGLGRNSIGHSTQTYSIRGIGESDPIQEAAVAVYADDLYIPRAIGSMVDFNDVERVEVLRGPQGTLYGRNSSAGAIRILTSDPSQETRARYELELGNYSARNARLLVSGPLVDDTLYASFSAMDLQRDGTVRNKTLGRDGNDIDSQAYRGKLRWAPTDSRWDVQLTLSGAFDHGESSSYTPFDANGRYDKFTTQLSWVPHNRLDQGSSVLRAIYQIDDHLSFKSVSAWSAFNQRVNSENSGAAAFIQRSYILYKQNYATQEFQLNGDYDRFNFSTGLFFFHERFMAERDSLTRNIAQNRIVGNGLYSTTRTDSAAIYSQGNYKLTDKLSLTAGLRFTHERKGFTFANYDITTDRQANGLRFSADENQTWNSWTPKLGLEYVWTDKLMQYASVSQGFKAGGYDNRATAAASAQTAFDPETVTTWETGIKGEFFNGRLRSNLALFYNDYKDLQASAYAPSIGNFYARINAGGAHTYGAELENQWAATDALQLTLNLGYLEAFYERFANAGGPGVDADDNRMPYSPRWTASTAASYRLPVNLPGELSFNTDLQYQARSTTNALNQPIYELPEQFFWNANLRYITADGHWSAGLGVKNILDRAYPQTVIYSASSGARAYGLNDPRTVLLSLSYEL